MRTASENPFIKLEIDFVNMFFIHFITYIGGFFFYKCLLLCNFVNALQAILITLNIKNNFKHLQDKKGTKNSYFFPSRHTINFY